MGKTTNVVLSFLKCKKHLHLKIIVVECKQMFKTTNVNLLVPFHKSKKCKMLNKILNEFKNFHNKPFIAYISFSQKPSLLALPRLYNFEALHSSTTVFFKNTFHCTHQRFASISSFLSMV